MHKWSDYVICTNLFSDLSDLILFQVLSSHVAVHVLPELKILGNPPLPPIPAKGREGKGRGRGGRTVCPPTFIRADQVLRTTVRATITRFP